MRLIDADACPKLFDAKFKETKRLILAGEKHLDNLAEGFMEANNVIRSMPTIAPPPNDPLTLDELREMDGEPVWVGLCRNAKSGKYVILDGYDQVLHCLRVIGGGLLDCTVMGKAWLAYRRKPEDET